MERGHRRYPSITKTYYYTGSQLIALRVLTGTMGNTLHFLHGDHLGSTSLTRSGAGALVARQYYYPYGGVRAGGGRVSTDRELSARTREHAPRDERP